MLGTVVRTFAHADAAGQSLVQYLPRNGTPKQIDAPFTDPHLEVDANSGAMVSSTNPELGIQLSQLDAEPVKGDRVSIGGTVYEIIDWQPDGEGGALLQLQLE